MFANIGGTDDDDEDFMAKPDTSAKLANLFETNDIRLDTDSSNRSLIYTPPKQPKRFELATNTTATDNVNNSGAHNANVMTLIHASAVNVFKFENDKYSSRGKLGAALLGNQETGDYKMVLYTGNKQHIAVSTITHSFKLICQPNNYSTFYDDNRQNWSLMFDTSDEKCLFGRQLAVCKYNWRRKSTETTIDSEIITQDLIVGNENSPVVADDNDNVELWYKGWLLDDNHLLGKLFVNTDSASGKPFCVKLTARWTQILKGMRMSAKRFAIISQRLKDDGLRQLLDNAPVSHDYYGFEFELIKIHTRVNRSDTKPPIETTKDHKNSITESNSLPNESHSSSSKDFDVKDDTSMSKQKSDILSRMARMGGLPILPVRPELSVAKSAEMATSDTTNDVTITDDDDHKPFPKPRNSSLTSQSSQMSETVNTLTSKDSTVQNSSQIQANTMSSGVYSAQMPTYFGPQNIETNLSILTAETRANSTEMRINMSKIIDKLDVVSEKVSDIKSSSLSSTPMHSMSSVSSIGFMDSAILLSSIQRIVDENCQLKKELDTKTSNLQNLNEKICDLLSNQQTNSNQQQSQQNSEQLDQLLMSETRLKRELIVTNEDCERLRTKNEELAEENQRLRQTVKELRVEADSCRQPTDGREFQTKLKRAMNDVFRKFNSQLDTNRTYSSDEIVDIVSKSIKSATLAVIHSNANSRTSSPYRQPADDSRRNSLQNSPKISDNNSQKELLLGPSGSGVDRDVIKPAIPMRKSIESQQKCVKSVPEDVIDAKVNEELMSETN